MPNGLIRIPDCFSFENQGTGVAVADLDGDGRPELIVFRILNPVGKNRGYDCIGRKLDGSGVFMGGCSDRRPMGDATHTKQKKRGGIARGLDDAKVRMGQWSRLFKDCSVIPQS